MYGTEYIRGSTTLREATVEGSYPNSGAFAGYRRKYGVLSSLVSASGRSIHLRSNGSVHLADYAKCLLKDGCLWSLQDDFIFSNADAEEHEKSKEDNKSKPKAHPNDSLSMKDLEALSKGGNADRFLDACITVCNGRSLFKTTTGLKGVGPQCLEEGDQICVLYGAAVPFVIRSDGTGGFLLVGECYVHDIMSGGVIQQLGNPRNGLKETWIPLS